LLEETTGLKPGAADVDRGLDPRSEQPREPPFDPTPEPVRRAAFGLYASGVFLAVITIVVAGILWGDWDKVGLPRLVFWLIACASSNLLPAPVTQNVQLTMSSPVNLAIAFLFPCPVATAMVAAASVTDWELSGGTTVLRAAFNRGQLALSTAVASAVFAWGGRPQGKVPSLWAIVTAVVAYHVANQTFVALAERFARGVPPREAFGRILQPLPSFLGSYLVLGFLGMVLAFTYDKVGWWAVAPLMVPLLFARHALRHSKQLELAERERRALADRLIDERERERARIASDIHDVVLQRLAAVQLEADNVTSALGAGDAVQAAKLARNVKEQMVGAIADLRGAIADLRRSGLDEADLRKTLERYVRSFHAETAIEVHFEVDAPDAPDIPLPVALLLYECAQEALTNVSRHSGATRVDFRLWRVGDAVELRIADNGKGPASAGDQRPRLGLDLTRDKVTLAGGFVWVHASPGSGVEVTVRVPVRRPE
jgi:signal transduction histidine kinase